MMLLAAEGAGLGTLTSAVAEWLSLAGTLLSTITGNPILCFFFAAGLITTAISIVSALKNA